MTARAAFATSSHSVASAAGTPTPSWLVAPGETLHARFQAQAQRTPGAPAVRYAGEELTYAALDERSNRLARRLLRAGVRRDERVGVLVERSLDLPVALLAILKAGAAYVPLDPALPAERLAFVMEDAGIRVVVAHDHLAAVLPGDAARVVSPTSAEMDGESGGALEERTDGDGLAYVIYTSGSTGRPKGTLVPHRAIPGFIDEYSWSPATDEDARPETWLQYASQSWDGMTLELWTPLLRGATCVLYPARSDDGVSPAGLRRVVEENGVTHLWMTSTFFNAVVDQEPGALAPLRVAMAGGEALSAAHLRRARARFPGLRLVNGYGPSECTVFTTTHTFAPGEEIPSTIPIGRAVGDRRCHVLGADLRPVPDGEEGELYVGGPAVPRGYLGRPRLTAAAMVPDPFADEPGARMYRTGDRVRRRADGVMEFLGRADDQVKIRGFRVEPGEVEAALREAAGVREAAVVVREDARGDKRLLAYVVGDGCDGAALRDALAARLPSYMVPTAVTVLDALPLTSTGKLDRRALPEPAVPSASAEQPATAAERAVAEIWREVLEADGVGAEDDFFALGGHSLHATRVIARARDVFRVPLSMRAIFDAPTVRKLAAEVVRLLDEGRSHSASVATDTDLPCFPASAAQQRLWLAEQMGEMGATYNMAIAARLHGALDGDALCRAVAELVRRHETLRTALVMRGGRLVQVIHPAVADVVERTDVSHLPIDERDAAVDALAAADAVRPLEVEAGRPFRATLVSISPDEHALLLSLHHAMADGWSYGVLFREVAALYAAFARGEASPLPEPAVRYADFAAWDEAQAGGAAAEADLAWWRARLAGAPALLSVPTDRPRPAVQRFGGDTVVFSIPADVAAAVREAARGRRATPFMALLAAWQALLGRWAGQHDVVVGSPVAGRTRAELEGVIGLFVNLLPLRADLSGDPTFAALLDRVRLATLDAFAHPALPFDRLVREVGAGRDRSHPPVFQAVFVLNGEMAPPEMEGVRMELRHPETGTSEFDLTLSLFEEGDGLTGRLTYRTSLFDAETIASLGDAYVAILRQASANPLARLSDVEIPPIGAGSHPTIQGEVPFGRIPGAMERAGSIPRARREGAIPASDAQRRLWLVDRLRPGSAAYNIANAFRVSGPLDAAALERALGETVRRHEALRTTFAVADGEPVQVISPAGAFTLPIVDLAAIPPHEREAAAARRAAEEAARPFDLERGPLFRAALLRLEADDHVLLLTLHHVVGDGWSMGVLYREMSALYAAFCAGLPSPLPEPRLQYADFAAWERSRDAVEMAEELAYWRARLAGAPAVLEMPADRPRPAIPSHRGGYVPVRVPAQVADGLRALARAEGATPFMALLAGWQALLARASGGDDVVVGSPIAGRTRAETEGLIGFFVNMLPLRGDLSGDPTFRQLLARMRAATLEAYAHQQLPFDRLVEEMAPERTLRHAPVFQVSFAFDNASAGALSLGAAGVSAFPQELSAAKYDLDLALRDGAGDWYGTLGYAADLFDASTARRLAKQLTSLLAAAVHDPDAPLSALAAIDAEERAALLAEWRAPMPATPATTVHALVAEQARIRPDAVAIARGGERVTYAELNARANRIARHLQSRGVGAETRVGVSMERGAELIAVLLGILKAGAAYVPLDPEYPAERLGFMLRDAGVSVAVATRETAARLPLDGIATVLVDAEVEEIARRSADEIADVSGPDGLAYVVYTSGSTGTPKGVGVPHRAVVRLVRGGGFCEMGADETWLQLAPVAFDASTLELWAPLANGGRVAPFPAGVPTPATLADFIAREGVTSLWLTAGLFHQVADARPECFGTVRQLLAGGDVLSPAHVRRAMDANPRLRIINGYGPTENTTFTCCHAIRPGDLERASIPLGSAIGGTRAYVLDAAMQPAAVGMPGELYAGGDGLARGYLGRPAATAERFVPDPFSPAPGARMYRTGDRARRLEDGTIEFLGRLDGQVKVRGFRVETGEIEAVLLAHPSIRAAAVAARDDAGDRRLIAWFAADDPSPRPAELRTHLRARLPEHMVPAAFVRMDALPLNANGKVDRRALPAPASHDTAASAYAAPRTETEAQLARIWAEVLRLERVGVEDDFFALGGHSLRATQVTSRAEEAFRVEVPLTALFEHKTVAGLARDIDRRREAGDAVAAAPIVPVARQARRPLAGRAPATPPSPR
jgi:amino acid adenylation domain-containing protein